MIGEYDIVELVEPLPGTGLNAGDTGTVLIVYDEKNLCVEFDEDAHFMEEVKSKSVKVVWSHAEHLAHD